MEDHAQENQHPNYFANYMQEIPKTPARNPSEQNYHMSPAFPFPGPFATPWIPTYYPIPETPQNHKTPSVDARNTLNRSKSLQFSRGLGDTASDSKRPWRPIKEKVDEILGLLKDWQWSIGILLYYIFAMKDVKGNHFEPTARHIQMVSKFLTGETQVGVGHILDLWLKSPYGLPPEENSERRMLYSTTDCYISIKYARPAITSFAALEVSKLLFLS
jgi:hypothetical protein